MLSPSEPSPERGIGDSGERGLSAWMDRYGDAVLRTALFRLKDRQKAEDVYQEVFLRVYRCEVSMQDIANPKAWILKVTLNACRDAERRPWWRQAPLLSRHSRETTESVERTAVLAETNRELWRAVSALAEPFRMCVLLYYYHELSTREIGDVLGVSEGTVRSRLHRARQLLKATLEGGGDDA
ncbi:RNA polymerase subunit sigma-24 [Cohnella xylanilytica]|uniref:sigma-70 family RNA polymerase sigma factor n=1 Tax=Cohnella xylanilytica TaxID=557555 RepID=UPI001B1AC8B3|nr:sigma-70 family RNA polymerase sigma factor [Cohnella xylanilytica]GIO14507.1 RNA polymerase subunit sigma-24 [Cohnella xylanilytica]